MTQAIAATVMRGGTSKGLYFLKKDLSEDDAERDRVLLAAMGSPDERQIDGMGGAHPLTSKVAVISKASDQEVDVDYLFLQVVVDRPLVSDGQNCGNILAGVGPYAIEQGMVDSQNGETTVRIRMLNSGGIAIATVQTPGGEVTYDGAARIDGVPGTAAPVMLDFADVAGSSCGALLPSGNVCDEMARYDDLVDGHEKPIDVSQVDVSMNGIELQDREFFAAIREGREPNSSVAQVLDCYRVLHEVEQQFGA